MSVAPGACTEYSLHRLNWPLPLPSRMTWRANSLNLPSVSAAKRFGFTYEGRMLWDRCFASLVLFCLCDPSLSSTGSPLCPQSTAARERRACCTVEGWVGLA